LTGIIGIDPKDWTLRRLFTAAEAKMRHDFDGPAMITAMLVNINRKEGSRLISFSQFNPYRKTKSTKPRINKNNLKMFAAAIVKKG